MTVIFTAEGETTQKNSRTGMLPLLIVLFVVSYAILTLVVVEQGRTIESQRTLLHEMLKDSTQLAQLKGKLAREEALREQPAAPPQQARPEPKDPASSNAPAAKAPDKEAKRSGKPTRSMKAVPGKPAADLEDVRRSTQVI